MEKRTILAIALSFAVIFLWSKFVYRPDVSQTQPLAPAAVVAAVPAQQAQPPAIALPSVGTEPEARDQEYALAGSTVTVSEPAGAIKQAIFDNYKKNPYVLNRGFYIAEPGLALVKKYAVNGGFTYIYEDKTKRITKTLYSSNSSYGMELDVRIVNTSPSPIPFNFPIILGSIDLDKQVAGAQRYDDIVISDQGKVSHPNFKKPASFPEIKFIGMRDQYFCAIIQPESTGYSGFVNKVSDKVYDIGISSNRIDLLPGNEVIQKFKVYLGPQDTDLINKSNPSWGSIVYFGMFDLVGQVILGFLKFLFVIVKNWGWAIVLMSIAIYLILFPLTIKQMKSMKEMQILQPKMEQLRKTYGDNSKKLNEEMMKLYKDHKVNPFGGCLPMILQIPIFISLYQVLSRSIALKGASFLWIKDLSEPDRLFKFPVTIPFIGDYFNILPVLMAIGMLIQQKMSAVSSSGQAAEQQKMMMIIFPIMFGIMFYNVPAGLVMYWFLNSTLMLFYQIKVMKSHG
jgi:YidC/Oxa1 family membrane protein insertase